MPDFKGYTLVPNLELEWFFSRRWSVSGVGNFVKRGYGGGKYFAISSWSLEPRLWLGRVHRNHNLFYLGLYGQAGDYDVRPGSAVSSGRTGRFFGAGVSFGAAIPFTRRVGIEVGLRCGYRHSRVKGYVHDAPDYYRESSGCNSHLGVTGLKASLYYRFGHKRQRP